LNRPCEICIFGLYQSFLRCAAFAKIDNVWVDRINQELHRKDRHKSKIARKLSVLNSNNGNVSSTFRNKTCGRKDENRRLLHFAFFLYNHANNPRTLSYQKKIGRSATILRSSLTDAVLMMLSVADRAYGNRDTTGDSRYTRGFRSCELRCKRVKWERTTLTIFMLKCRQNCWMLNLLSTSHSLTTYERKVITNAGGKCVLDRSNFPAVSCENSERGSVENVEC
jgi:hypothetical protein